MEQTLSKKQKLACSIITNRGVLIVLAVPSSCQHLNGMLMKVLEKALCTR